MTGLRRLGLTLLVFLVYGLGPLSAQERTASEEGADDLAELRAKLDRRLSAIQSLAGPALTFGSA